MGSRHQEVFSPESQSLDLHHVESPQLSWKLKPSSLRSSSLTWRWGLPSPFNAVFSVVPTWGPFWVFVQCPPPSRVCLWGEASMLHSHPNRSRLILWSCGLWCATGVCPEKDDGVWGCWDTGNSRGFWLRAWALQQVKQPYKVSSAQHTATHRGNLSGKGSEAAVWKCCGGCSSEPADSSGNRETKTASLQSCCKSLGWLKPSIAI